MVADVFQRVLSRSNVMTRMGDGKEDDFMDVVVIDVVDFVIVGVSVVMAVAAAMEVTDGRL